MRRQSLQIRTVFVVLAMTTICLPPPAHAFWYGNQLADLLDAYGTNAYHNFLADKVVPQVMQSLAPSAFNNNPEDDKGVTVYEPDKCWQGYTLLSSIWGHRPDPSGPRYNAMLVDMEGKLVKQWSFAISGVPMKMLPGGYVMGGSSPPRLEGHLTQLDWDGNRVWEVDLHVHHDHQREGNPVGYYAPGMQTRGEGGKTLVLDRSFPDPKSTSHISDFALIDDVIWEVDWEGNVLWQWHGWEHFEQMGFDEVARRAIKTVPVLVGDPDQTDYLHINSISWLGPNRWYDQGDLRFHPDNIIFDGRSCNLSGIIARHDHPDGEWKSGDIVWRVGPHFTPAYPEHKLRQVIGQHMVHIIPRGLPGAGNILMFDNGGYAGFGPLVSGSTRGTWPNTLRDFSRIVEFNPITLERVWEWTQPKPTADYDGDGDIKGKERQFLSTFNSGVQRLQNGNTLVCEALAGRVFELTQEGDIVWEFISPYFTSAVFDGFVTNVLYRAYRVPYEWAPIPAPAQQ